jgi:urease accessory protein
MTNIAGMTTAMTTSTSMDTPTQQATSIRMTETPAARLALQVWLSPSFPVGAFAYSHGIEAAVDAGDIHDAASLQGWIGDLVAYGALRNDAVLLALAYRATQAADWGALRDVNGLALALAPSKERHLETSAQGTAFVTAARAAWPCRELDTLAEMAAAGTAYPVALATAAAAHGVSLVAALEAYGLAFISNLVSAAVRLGPIGQTDGQRIIAALMEAVAACATYAAKATVDDLGGAAMRSDIAAMRHETLYSRLFRS